MELSVPEKVGLVVFATCIFLGLPLETTIIICTVHYIAHQVM